MRKGQNFVYLLAAFAFLLLDSPKVEAKKKKEYVEPPYIGFEGQYSFSMPGEFSKTYSNIDKLDTQVAETIKIEKTRTPANASVASEGGMSPALKTLRNRYLNDVKTGADLGRLLNEMDRNYDSYPDDAKFFAARLMPVQAFEGFAWKMLPIIRQSRMAQEAAVGILRGLSSQLNIRFPDNENDAVFQYMTQPQAGDATAFHGNFANLNVQFVPKGDDKGERIMQMYMSRMMVGDPDSPGKITQAIKRIEALNFSNNPIVMDAKVRFGDSMMDNNSDPKRFHFIGDAERYAVLSRMHRRMATLSVLLAYDFNGFIEYRQEIAHHLGVDIAKSKAKETAADALGERLAARTGLNHAFELQGLTRENRVGPNGVIKSYPNLFKLRTDSQREYKGEFKALQGKALPIGNIYTIAAYHHLERSVDFMNASWKLMNSPGHTSSNILEVEFLGARDKEITEALKAMADMTPAASAPTGRYVLHSVIENKTVAVDLRNFFFYPPQNLQSLLPKSFDKGANGANKSNAMVVTTINGKQTAYRDHTQGRATGWDQAAFKKIFPDLANGYQVDEIQ
ncbi:MAG: hypothetical protein AB7O96_12030 [Pseudobdellovibrionaceae bacterium]